ncbi:unnamed protein product [Darwinula stevensoni]|uniref:AFP-like domain-containing protein n=1 Tax=Darwinula stevensoni TaxID=69355 RepID=A0A7R9ACW2_9CRUS|nr:unnamed protein product [Darwinula stevensoni]CAG0900197.1 unnamed protein product [Darwinula stevensoni]
MSAAPSETCEIPLQGRPPSRCNGSIQPGKPADGSAMGCSPESFGGFEESTQRSPVTVTLAPGLRIGAGEPCLVIAEIGQNHQGDIRIAEKLIRVAKEAGAGCAKLQKRSLPDGFTSRVLRTPYDSPNSWGETYEAHKRHLEFTEEQVRHLRDYAWNEVGIPLIATPMDIPSADLLQRLDAPFFKIGSGDTNNFLLLDHVASFGKPMLVSTGMQSMETVRAVYELLKDRVPLVLLQCTSAYPSPAEAVNLNVLRTYQREFPEAIIGYSGHELGMVATLGAVAMGAKVVERHITLDKTWKGSDHEVSLEPRELTRLVESIREMEACFGDGVKRIVPCEWGTKVKLGKTVVSSRFIPAGTVLQNQHLSIKVAQEDGVLPENYQMVVGRVLGRDLEPDMSIKEEYLK